MRHVTRSVALILLLAVSTQRASAAGVGLRWDACVADGGAINRSFACNTNAGNLFLVCSFVLDQPLASVGRVDVSLELASASAALPAWWDLATCRPNSLAAGSIVPTSCVSPAGTPGVFGVVIGEHGPNTLRIEAGRTILNRVTLGAGTENIVVALQLNVLKTVGIGACGGCGIPACIVVRSVSFLGSVTQPPLLVLTQPLNGTDANFVTWQGGGVGCPGATPVRRTVWGSLKALYR